MISVEEKLRVFTQYLLKKERTWGKDIVNEAKEKRLKLLEASEIKMKKEKTSSEERSYHTVFRDKNKIIAEGKNKAKTLELEENNRILIDFNNLILEKAKDFLKTETYKNYLENCVNEISEVFKEKKELIIFVKSGEKETIEKMIKKNLSDYQIICKDQINEMIGGMIVQDIDNKIHCDFTVDNLIKTNYKLIGMTLNGFMKEQVN